MKSSTDQLANEGKNPPFRTNAQRLRDIMLLESSCSEETCNYFEEQSFDDHSSLGCAEAESQFPQLNEVTKNLVPKKAMTQLHKIDEQSSESHLESVDKQLPVPSSNKCAKQDVSMEAARISQDNHQTPSNALPLVTNEGQTIVCSINLPLK